MKTFVLREGEGRGVEEVRFEVEEDKVKMVDIILSREARLALRLLDYVRENKVSFERTADLLEHRGIGTANDMVKLRVLVARAERGGTWDV